MNHHIHQTLKWFESLDLQKDHVFLGTKANRTCLIEQHLVEEILASDLASTRTCLMFSSVRSIGGSAAEMAKGRHLGQSTFDLSCRKLRFLFGNNSIARLQGFGRAKREERGGAKAWECIGAAFVEALTAKMNWRENQRSLSVGHRLLILSLMDFYGWSDNVDRLPDKETQDPKF